MATELEMPRELGRGLVRTSRARGTYEVIHVAGCAATKRAKQVTPWKWAEGRPVDEWPSWFVGCQRCLPHLSRRREPHDGCHVRCGPLCASTPKGDGGDV